MAASTPYDTDEDWEGEGQLDLADDESLPWLEAGEDEDEAAGFDTSRLWLMGVLALALLAVVIGGIWFFSNQASDEPPADGSVIAAPDAPYKTKPENPGGKTFAGTGDTSFAVGEGQTREGKLAEPAAAPAAGDGTRLHHHAGCSVQLHDGVWPRRHCVGRVQQILVAGNAQARPTVAVWLLVRQ